MTRRGFIAMLPSVAAFTPERASEATEIRDRMISAFNGSSGWVQAFNSMQDELSRKPNPMVLDLNWQKRSLLAIRNSRTKLKAATDLHERLMKLLEGLIRF